MAAALRPQGGQHGTSKCEEAEYVDVELLTDLRLFAFFNRAHVTVARVVHEDIDPAKPRESGIDRGCDLLWPGEVQFDAKQPVRPGAGEIHQRLFLACSHHAAAAARENCPRQRDQNQLHNR